MAERDPSWSPDGKSIAYFSDESGEYALHLRDQSGLGEVRKIGLGAALVFLQPRVVARQQEDRLHRQAAQSLVRGPRQAPSDQGGHDACGRLTLNPDWSPDSRWLAYTKPLKSWLRAVFVYSLEEGKSHQVTDGLSDARFPLFDKGGKYIYFSASTDTANTSAGLDMSRFPLRPTRSLYLVVLDKQLKSPLAPESDEEKGDEKPAGQDGGKKADAPAAGPKKEPARVVIDLDNIGQRIVALPVPARSYAGLAAGKAGILYVVESVPPGPGITGAVVHKFDLDKRKVDKVLENVNGFTVSANGEKMLYRQARSWFIAATAQPVKPGEGRLKTDDAEVYVDPTAEWKQMYREVWRLERDFFYDPELPRFGSRRRLEEIRALSRQRRASRRFELPVRRDAGGTERRPPVCRRRRCACSATHQGRPARRRLSDRKWPIPLRPHLQRRELESRAARPPDAARCERRRRANTCFLSTGAR